MNKIESFKVNHLDLYPGIYISRQDIVGGEPVITYDIRMTYVNHEPAIDPAAMHTIEHIGATMLRNGSLKDDIIYFGPMGCCTGFYLIMKGEHPIVEIKQIILGMMSLIANWKDDEKIPGYSPKECGNYKFHNLDGARNIAKKYMTRLVADFHCEYPKDDFENDK